MYVCMYVCMYIYIYIWESASSIDNILCKYLYYHYYHTQVPGINIYKAK